MGSTRYLEHHREPPSVVDGGVDTATADRVADAMQLEGAMRRHVARMARRPSCSCEAGDVEGRQRRSSGAGGNEFGHSLADTRAELEAVSAEAEGVE
jgi:hypothetical protein